LSRKEPRITQLLFSGICQRYLHSHGEAIKCSSVAKTKAVKAKTLTRYMVIEDVRLALRCKYLNLR